MAASSRLMITEAEAHFSTRIRIGVPPDGLGRQLDDMIAWLDANCGTANWAMAPAGLRGVVNDALAIFFLDPALANAFVTRWCLGHRLKTDDGSFTCAATRYSLKISGNAREGFHKTPPPPTYDLVHRAHGVPAIVGLARHRQDPPKLLSHRRRRARYRSRRR